MDVVIIIRQIVNEEPYDPTADFTGDNQVNIIDVVQMIQYIVNSSPPPSDNAISYSQNFDSLTLQAPITEKLSEWILWPGTKVDAYVVDDQYESEPHSLELIGDDFTDVVLQVGKPFREGNFELHMDIYMQDIDPKDPKNGFYFNIQGGDNNGGTTPGLTWSAECFYQMGYVTLRAAVVGFQVKLDLENNQWHKIKFVVIEPHDQVTADFSLYM